MLEALPVTAIYSFARDIWRTVSGYKSRKGRKDLASREKWKAKIQNHFLEVRSKDLRDDIIIRDLDRYNEYPDLKSQNGISSWFKLGFLELYHNGIKAGLKTSSLVYEESEASWRKASDDEIEYAINAYLVGYIPFRNIVSIDFDGDEFYSFPHFTCEFSIKGMPYEALIFCEKREFMPGRFYFSELETDDRVRLTSSKFGTDAIR